MVLRMNVEQLKRKRCMMRGYVGYPEPVGLVLVRVLDDLGQKIKKEIQR